MGLFSKKADQPAPKAKPEDNQDLMFPPIGDDEPEDNNAGAEEEYLPGYKTREDAEKAFTGMQDSMKSMQTQQQTLQQMLDQMVAGRGQGTSQQPEQGFQFDISKLPDPVEDKDGFVKGMFEQVDKLVDHRTKTASSAGKREKDLDSLWDRFNDKYEDLAVDQGIVELAARDVVQDASMRGLDVDRVVFANPDRFLEQVADRTRGRLDGLKKHFAPADADPPPANRTDGVSGGSHGKAAGKGDEGKFGSFLGDLKKMQRDSGFF